MTLQQLVRGLLVPNPPDPAHYMDHIFKLMAGQSDELQIGACRYVLAQLGWRFKPERSRQWVQWLARHETKILDAQQTQFQQWQDEFCAWVGVA